MSTNLLVASLLLAISLLAAGCGPTPLDIFKELGGSSSSTPPPTSAPLPPALSPIDISKIAQDNVLFVVAPNGGRASAIYLGNEQALTAKHVCDAANMASVVLLDSKKGRYKVKRVRRAKNPQVDLCFLDLKKTTPNTPTIPGVIVATHAGTLVGQEVYVGGFSGGIHYSFRSCRVYSKESTYIAKTPFPMFESDFLLLRLEWCAVIAEPGISGSGMLNYQGLLVGIAAAAGPTAGLGFVPTYEVIEFLKAVGYGQKPSQ